MSPYLYFEKSESFVVLNTGCLEIQKIYLHEIYITVTVIDWILKPIRSIMGCKSDK